MYKVKDVIFEHYIILVSWQFLKQKKTEKSHPTNITC